MHVQCAGTIRQPTAEAPGRRRDRAGAFTHLEALQRIADNNGGNRASPGPGYDASVDYMAGILRDAGYEVSTLTFRVRDTNVRNVIAQTRTGDPGRVIMAGAHLDSVIELAP